MIGLVTNLMRDGHPLGPDNGTAPCVLATFPGDPTHPDPAQRRLEDQPCTFTELPPPLSLCRFTDDKTPHCLGPIGLTVDEVLHEHFTYVQTSSGGAAFACDTPWRQAAGTGGIAQATAAGLGVIAFNTTAVLNNLTAIRKTDSGLLVPSADALWMATQFGPNAVTSQMAWVGFENDAFTRQALMLFDPSVSTSWIVQSTDGSGSSTITGVTCNAAELPWIDLVLVPDLYLAGWINGDGPYVVTSNIPGAGDSLEPTMGILTTTAAVKQNRADSIHVDAIGGQLAHPLTDPLLTPIAA